MLRSFISTVAIDCAGNSEQALELQNFLLAQGFKKAYPGNNFTDSTSVLITQYRGVEGTFGFAPCAICYKAENVELFKALACMTHTAYGIPNEYWLCVKNVSGYVNGECYKAVASINQVNEDGTLVAFPDLFMPVSEFRTFFQKASMEDLVSALG